MREFLIEHLCIKYVPEIFSIPFFDFYIAQNGLSNVETFLQIRYFESVVLFFETT